MTRPTFLPLFSFVAGLSLWTVSAFAAPDTALSLRVDPTFSRSKLTTEEQRWYDLAWSHSNGCNSLVTSRSLTDDLYTYGRSIGDYNSFMLMGLRSTGDRKFLDRVMVVTDAMRTKLADADDACVGGATDGFLDWRWRALNAGDYSCTNTGGFYGSDHHQLDEAMTHGNMALIAYAFTVNADLDTAYASRAQFWTNYLLKHWEAKWIQRAGGDSTKAWMDNSGMYKHEAHVVANIMRAAYYLWKITGNPFYKARADGLQARCAANCVLNPNVPTGYSWHHQVDNQDTWQAINYAEYTSSVFCDLHFDGYAPYAGTPEISRFMSTWRDIVFKNSSPSFSTMAPNVYGDGTAIAITGSGASAYARWDDTGKLAAYANAVSGRSSPGSNSIYTIRLITGMECAISTRSSTANTPPARIANLTASQVADVSVTLTWTAPADDAGPAASYQLRSSSQAITDANFASATVVPITLVPQAAGSAETFVVNGLTPGRLYVFAIRAVDGAGSAASVSNNVSATTKTVDAIPPGAIDDLYSP